MLEPTFARIASNGYALSVESGGSVGVLARRFGRGRTALALGLIVVLIALAVVAFFLIEAGALAGYSDVADAEGHLGWGFGPETGTFVGKLVQEEGGPVMLCEELADDHLAWGSNLASS